MIHCRVYTNDDWLQCTDWPTQVTCKPENGDRMQAGEHGQHRIGKVCSVTHAMERDVSVRGYVPVLIIEITKIC